MPTLQLNIFVFGADRLLDGLAQMPGVFIALMRIGMFEWPGSVVVAWAVNISLTYQEEK